MSVVWGFMKFKANPEKCYREIESMGECKPEQIVEFARNEKTELHKCFEWNDTKAAENWRIQQARIVCNSLTVVIETETIEPKEFKLIEHDQEQKVYRPVILTVRNEDQYKRLLNQAKDELAAFKKRYASLKELATVIGEIERVLQ